MTSIRFSFKDEEKINYLILEWDVRDPQRPDVSGMSKIVTDIVEAVNHTVPIIKDVSIDPTTNLPLAKRIPVSEEDDDPTQSIILT